MKISIKREALLKPLQVMSGVVEKRQTMPILANVLITVKDNQLFLTGTDLEIELIGNVMLDQESDPGSITVSARKLFDICRALPENSLLQLTLEGDHVLVRSGRSRFMLATLPAQDFPSIEEGSFTAEFAISQVKLKKLLGKVYFAMGQQDVRHHLNGALLDIHQGTMKCVATDGHRLALDAIHDVDSGIAPTKIILPRKSVLELMRLLDVNTDESITLLIGANHFRIKTTDFVFTSKLVSAQYPDYDRLIPRNTKNTAMMDRETLRQALARAAILSNEKFRVIRLQLETDSMQIMANNPEQEEAEEKIQIEYQGDSIEIAFNVAYLLDAVSAITTESIHWSFSDPSGGVLLESAEKDHSLYVVMPMKL